MASSFKIIQYGKEIKRGIRFIFKGNFNYSVMIDANIDGKNIINFFTWSGAAPGDEAERPLLNNEKTFSNLSGKYQRIDGTGQGSFSFSPSSGTIPLEDYIEVFVTPIV